LLYLDFIVWRDSDLSLIEKLLVLRGPPQYYASDTQDFNENINSVRFPAWKYIFLPDCIQKSYALVHINQVGIDIERENRFLYNVRLHDDRGEINAYWADLVSLNNYLVDFGEDLRERINKNPERFMEMLSLHNEISERDADFETLRERFVKEMQEETYSLVVKEMSLIHPSITYEEVKANEGLKEKDHVYHVIIARNLKEGTNQIDFVSKYPYTSTKERSGVTEFIESKIFVPSFSPSF